MNNTDLLKELSFIKNAKRIYRDNAADLICQHPETFPYLLKPVFDTQSKHAIKATWVLEIDFAKKRFLRKYWVSSTCKIYFKKNLHIK